jgi:hypothetical protein
LGCYAKHPTDEVRAAIVDVLLIEVELPREGQFA